MMVSSAALIAGTVGTVLGFATGLGLSRWVQYNPVGLMILLLGRRRKQMSNDAFRRRMRRFLPLTVQKVMLFLGICWLNPMCLAAFLPNGWAVFFLLYALVAVGATIFVVRLFAEFEFDKLQPVAARLAASQAMRRLPAHEVVARLQCLIDTQNPKLQTIAAQYLGWVGTEEAQSMLTRLSEDANPEISAAALLALKRARSLAFARPIDLPSNIDAALLAYQHQLWPQYSAPQDGHVQDDGQIEAAERAIDELLLPQWQLKQDLPHVYCTRCNARYLIQTQYDWSWLICKVCKKNDRLQAGIRKVIGEIGGVTEARLIDGHYHINLWSISEHAATRAEIDVLKIVGGKNLPYDWAVDKVVAILEEQGLSRLDIELVQDPVLTANSMAILHSIGKVKSR